MVSIVHHEREDGMRSCAGMQLFTQTWHPSGCRPAKALVFLVHGIHSHSSWFASTCRTLARVGYAVYCYDQQGHGRSQGSRSYFGRFSDLLDDLQSFVDLQRCRRRYRGVPCFLLGASTGATIALLAAHQRPDVFAGVLMVSPVLRGERRAGSVDKLAGKLASRFLPHLRIGSVDSTRKTRDVRRSSSEGRVRRARSADKLSDHGAVQARPAMELEAAFQQLSRAARDLDVPVAAFAGQRDRSISMSHLARFLDTLSSDDVTLHYVERGHHDLLHEHGKDDLCALVLDWLDSRL